MFDFHTQADKPRSNDKKTEQSLNPQTLVERIRSDFPIIHRNPECAYLDNGASSQKPYGVIERIKSYYESENANIHRGVYRYSEIATQAYEAVRATAARFLGAKQKEEIIFTRGTTESINLVAQTWGRANLKPDDEILLTVAEHHSNIVPWQMLAEHTGAKVRYIPLGSDYRLDIKQAERMVNKRTKVLSLGHVSNVLGVIHPVKHLVAAAKAVGAVTVVDGAQATPHLTINVQDLDCDFYATSGHKMVGPTGVGLLYGKLARLEEMPPYQGGGDMIESVTLEGSTWAPVPQKFEAGTPNIAGVIGLGAAIEYLESLPRSACLAHEVELGKRALQALKAKGHYRFFIENLDDWVGVVTFFHDKAHPHDIAAIADSFGVCLRAGHHCAQPLMRELGVPATTRMSPYIYNTEHEVDRFLEAMEKVDEMFG